MKTRIVSGFPGVGKTTLVNRAGSNGQRILDSDSSQFSWQDASKGIRHPEWPRNYIQHIKDNEGLADIILVSSHDVVRKALGEANVQFTLVYPSLDMKREYIQRYVDRGNNDAFVNLLQKNYEAWIAELMDQKGCDHIVLTSGQYLADVI